MRRATVCTLAALVAAVPLTAHDGHEHRTYKTTGAVKTVYADLQQIEITTEKGKKASFHVDQATKYFRDGTPITLSQLKPGARVVVTARIDGGRRVATEVRLGPGGENASGPAEKPRD